jgi:hypothetical protein
MPLSKSQLALINAAYDALPGCIKLYKWQWKTARCLKCNYLAAIAHDGTLILYSHTIQLINLGRAMK